MESATEKLIALVKSRPLIYERVLKKQNTKHNRNTLWREISFEMGLSVSECMRKWIILRNCYARIMRNTRSSKKKRKTKWHLEEKLSFLENHIQPYKRRKRNNLKKPKTKLKNVHSHVTKTSNTSPTEQSSFKNTNELLPKRQSRKLVKTILLKPEPKTSVLNEPLCSFPSTDKYLLDDAKSFNPMNIDSSSLSFLPPRRATYCSRLTTMPNSNKITNLPLKRTDYQSTHNPEYGVNLNQQILADDASIYSTISIKSSPISFEEEFHDSTVEIREPALEMREPAIEMQEPTVETTQTQYYDNLPSNNNSNLLFLKSILPDFDKLPDKKQRIFKIKTLELLESLFEDED